MADPKIVKNIHIQQWNGDENYWSTQKPLMEGEIGIVNKTNTKNAANIVVGNGTFTTSELLEEGNVFYPGIGAGYVLPTASGTVHGGIKIADNYFYVDQGLLKPKTLRLIEDDNPDNPDEFNKANKSGNQALISAPTTDWKLQGDFYAETLYADEARIKNIVYEKETNIEYSGKYIDIHKNAIDYELTEFSVQLSSEHYSEGFGGYIWHLDQLYGPIQMPSQDITVSNSQLTTKEAYFQASVCNFFPLSSGGYKITGSVDIGENVFLSVAGISIRHNRNWIYLTNVSTHVNGTMIDFEGEIASLPVASFEVGQLIYNSVRTITSTITLPAIDELSAEQSFKVDDYSFSFSLSENMITLLVQGLDPNITNTSIVFYDNVPSTPVLKEGETAGIRIFNYNINDEDVSGDQRKTAELSVNNHGILKYASDNSSMNYFSDILMINKTDSLIQGFYYLYADPKEEGITYSILEQIPTQCVDLSGIKNLTIACNAEDAGTYTPLGEDSQYININACTSIITNGNEHTVDPSGKITLSDSAWTNELYSLLSSAVQKITFDDEEFSGPTITLKSKIQKITLDGLATTIGEDGSVDLKSKIQSITYDGVKHDESDIVIYATKLSSLETTKGSGADEQKYNTINITEDPATRTYLISHYDTKTINEPVGTDTNIIGESGSKTSFNLMSNLSYDHYGHAERYSSYTLDFSRLVARIEELETKVAELEEQLKAS